MRLVLFANNRVGLAVTQYLRRMREEIVGLVVHPDQRAKFKGEIIHAAGVEADAIVEADQLGKATTLARLRDWRGDLGISVFFGYILKPPVLQIFPQGILNIHPSYLPFNRGAHPNVWSIVEGTPAGATIHFIDEGIDTGDIVAQVRVSISPADTGLTLYRKLENACIQLFEAWWPRIKKRDFTRVPQSSQEGTRHLTRDLAVLDRIDLEKTYHARKLIDILRARTFPPYPSAYFEMNGRRYYIEISITPENDEAGNSDSEDTTRAAAPDS